MDDRAIIALYNARDEQAIAETAHKYGTHCLAVAENILASIRDSEECVNDTWLQTWNSIPPANPHSLRAWLSRITRNLALNRLAARSAEKRAGDPCISNNGTVCPTCPCLRSRPSFPCNDRRKASLSKGIRFHRESARVRICSCS